MRKPSSLRRFLTLGLLVFSTCFRDATAYVHITDDSGIYVVAWDPGSLPVQVKLANSPALTDGTTPSGSVTAAMQTWNAQIKTVQFVPNAVGPIPYANGNSINEIVMDSTVDGDAFPSGVLAVTLSYRSGNARTESDIVFNTAYTWDSFSGGQLSGKQDLRRVALHELGHVLGLDHPDESGQSVTAIMNSHVSYSPAIDALKSDDIAGAQALYGAPGFIPANDNFSNASTIALGGGSIQGSGTNVAATAEPGEHAHAGESPRHSIWWKWTPSSDGNATVTTLGSNFDTVLAVYQGSAVSSLVELASNDDVTNGAIRTSSVSFSATSGIPYYIAVDGWDGYVGLVKLNLTFSQSAIGPSITSQPISRTAVAGESVSFGISASGLPAPSFRWQRLTGGVGSWNNLSDGGNYSGTSTATLEVHSVVLAMNGDQFRCVASNPGGSATSNSATLSVNSPPSFILAPVDQVVEVGYLAQFSAAAVGNPGPTYQWQRLPSGGTWANISNGSGYSGVTSTTLTINPTTQAMTGDQFRCVASNSIGSVSSTPAGLLVNPSWAIIATATGSNHSLFIRADNSLWAMGENSSGQLGDGTFINRLAPVRVASDVTAVAAGSGHSLFIKSDGTLWSMGDNSYGQLGDGTTTKGATPRQIATGVIAVDGANAYSVYIRSNGTLWSVGYNLFGAAIGPNMFSTPRQVAQAVTAVSAADSHCLFIKSDHSLWGSGSRQDGRIADGFHSNDNTSEPVHVTDGVIAVSVGYATTTFLRENGTLWGTGYNQNGALGPVAGSIWTPVQIASDVAAISAGSLHLLFKKTDQTLWAAGLNEDGQLGVGTFSSGLSRSVPTQVASGVSKISAGIWHSLFTKTDGTLWGMGSATYGRLGLSGGPYNTPQLIRSGAFPPTPSFTVQPTNTTTVAVVGHPRFNVAVSTVGISFQWQRLAAGGVTWSNLTDGAFSSGVTTGTLSLGNITGAMNGDQFRCVATNITGTAVSDAATLRIILARSAAANDFNADRRSDVLWRNRFTGQVGTWLMIDANRSAGYSVLAYEGDGWEIFGTGDFNADGQTDLLWRNRANGQIGVWLMNGTQGMGYVLLAYEGDGWEIFGTGDFNADGQTDLLWRNRGNGQIGVWLMDGVRSTGFVLLAYEGDSWEIFGTGDFNADGQSDLLWRNTTTGEVGAWLMDGTRSTGFVHLANQGVVWQIIGCGDFNADGYSDIIWSNTSDGQVGAWLMNGLVNTGYVLIAYEGEGWELFGY